MPKALSKHFNESEFQCKCCGVVKIDQVLVDKLEQVRVIYNKPMNILSGYRCPHHNAEVGGVDNSYHMKGMAADISCDTNTNRYFLLKAIMEVGFNRIGIYKQGFIHVDIGDYPTHVTWVDK